MFPNNIHCLKTSVGDLYIEERQDVLIELESTGEEVLSIILDAYNLRVAPFISSRPAPGRDIIPNRHEWLILTKDGRVFGQEDYLMKRLSCSKRVLNKYQDVHALTSRGLNIDIGS